MVAITSPRAQRAVQREIDWRKTGGIVAVTSADLEPRSVCSICGRKGADSGHILIGARGRSGTNVPS